MSSIAFDLNLFMQDSKNILINPNKYFSSMKTTGGITDPLIKGIAYGILTGIVYLVCWILRIRSFGAGYVGDAVGILAFIKIIAGTVIGSGIGALIMIVISASCRGNTEFEPNFRVTTSLMAILPVYSILSIFWNFSIYIGIIISLIISVYFLWLLHHAMTAALKCRIKNVRVFLYGLFVIIVLFLFLNLRFNSKKENEKENVTGSQKAVRELKKNDVK